MSFTDPLVIHLKGGSPWGFTLAGGLDKRQLLTVSKVAVGGKAHKAGVIEGYHITKINGEETFQMNHNDAKSVIKNAGWQFMLELSKPGGWQQSDSLSVTPNSSDVMPSPPSSVCSNGRNQESGVQRDFYRPSPKPYSSSSSSTCSERRSPAGSCSNLKKAECKSRHKFSTPFQNNIEIKKGVDISQALVRLIKKEEDDKANEQKISSSLNDEFPSPPPEGQQKSTAHKTIGNILSGAVNAAKSPPKAANEPDFAKTLENRCVGLGEPAVLRVDLLPCQPQPTVHWYHNKKEVHTNVENDIRVQNTKLIHTVILGTLTKEQTGWYTCTIINKHGSSSSRCQVTIDAQKSHLNKPAYIEDTYKKDSGISAQKVLTSSNQKLYSTQNSANAYKKQTNNIMKKDNLKKESEVLKALRLDNEISQQPVRKSKTMQYLEHSLQSDDY